MKTLFYLVLCCTLTATFLGGCNSDSNEVAGPSFKVNSSISMTAARVSANNVEVNGGATTYTGKPASVNYTFYTVWLSQNADCSNPVLVQDHGTAGSNINMASGATIFSGTPTDGTYNCMIMKFADTFTFTPDATAEANVPGGVCEAGISHTQDIYRAGESDSDSWLDINGNNITSTGSMTTSGIDTVYIFASTNANAVPSTTAVSNQVLTLSSALTVPGNAIFYFSLDDEFSVGYQNNDCWTEEPHMGFR